MGPIALARPEGPLRRHLQTTHPGAMVRAAGRIRCLLRPRAADERSPPPPAQRAPAELSGGGWGLATRARATIQPDCGRRAGTGRQGRRAYGCRPRRVRADRRSNRRAPKYGSRCLGRIEDVATRGRIEDGVLPAPELGPGRALGSAPFDDPVGPMLPPGAVASLGGGPPF